MPTQTSATPSPPLLASTSSVAPEAKTPFLLLHLHLLDLEAIVLQGLLLVGWKIFRMQERRLDSSPFHFKLPPLLAIITLRLWFGFIHDGLSEVFIKVGRLTYIIQIN